MNRSLAGIAAIALAPLLCGQVIRVQTREVVVDVTVTDKKNSPVTDLRQSDFTVLDDGKPRVIDTFSVSQTYSPISAQIRSPLHPPSAGTVDKNGAPDTGHSTAIILDEVNTFFEDAAQARQNVLNVMTTVPADERIALYVIVRKQGLILLQDYTTDRNALRQSLAKHFPSGMKPASSNHFYVDQPTPPGAFPPANEENAAAMWRENDGDARLSLQALADQLANVSGRKSVFWVTNGFHPWILGLGNRPTSPAIAALDMEKPAWDKTFAALNEANVAVNVVDSRGLYAASNPVLGTIAVMEEVAEKTGGKAYYGRNDLDGAIDEGIAGSRTTYTLRFHMADEERDNRFHTLQVKVDRPGVQAFHRQGYYAGGAPAGADLVAGKIAGQELESRAASAMGTIDVAMQLPFFYTGTNRASVHLSAEMVPAGMTFRKDATGLHGQIEVVGSALRPDGGEAARFADSVRVDLEDQAHADVFMHSPYHYEHPFTLGAGTYIFRLELGAGSDSVGKKEVPLTVEPWNSSSFAMGGIALSHDARPVAGPIPTGSLVAGGKVFAPAASNRFLKSGPAYFYTEVYDSAPGSLAMEYLIFDAKIGEVKLDTGMAGVGSFVRPGSSVVPFAIALPVGQLAAGSYRLEVRAGHTGAAEVVKRTIDFEVY